MKKGFILQSEALLSVFIAFVAFTLLIMTIMRFDLHWNQRVVWEKKQLEAASLSDMIAKRLVDGGGNVDIAALAKADKDNAEIRIGSRAFGLAPPANVSLFYVRRIVFVDGKPEVMEVRVW